VLKKQKGQQLFIVASPSSNNYYMKNKKTPAQSHDTPEDKYKNERFNKFYARAKNVIV
jgi:hypothetical protein